MAARYPIRLAPLRLSAPHPQSNANATSLAGGSAYSYGPLVLKDRMCPISYVRAAINVANGGFRNRPVVSCNSHCGML